MITLAPFGYRFECDEDEPILEAALRNGHRIRHGCTQGQCGSCKTRVIDGAVEMIRGTSFALMDFEEEEGFALMCSSLPLTDATLDLHDYKEEDLRDA